MTRVALLPSAYLPDLGGVEQMSHQLARALVAAGDQVEVWTAKVPALGAPQTDTVDGIDVIRFPYVLPAARLASLVGFPPAALAALGAMRRAVKRFRPDVLHVNCFGPNGVYGSAMSRLSGIPLVVTLHGETLTNDHRVFERSAVLRRSLTWAMGHADEVTGCSAYAIDDARERFGLAPDRGRIIFNGIDLTDGAVAPRSPADPDPGASRTMVAAGRFVAMKGFDLLLDAFAQATSRHPDWRLVLAGDGPNRADLVERSARLGTGDVVGFPGTLDRSQMRELLDSAGVLVLPSRSESFGLVILEAWRSGVPVVATTRGGPPEFVRDGTDGLLVDPIDVPALAAAIDKLLGDDDLRRALGRAGLSRVGEFDWRAVAERYRQIYERARSISSR